MSLFSISGKKLFGTSIDEFFLRLLFFRLLDQTKEAIADGSHSLETALLLFNQGVNKVEGTLKVSFTPY